jgi:hypothetical protein
VVILRVLVVVCKEILVNRDLLELKGQLDHLDHLVTRDLLEDKGLRVQEDLRVLLVHEVFLDHLDKEGMMALMVRMV